MNECKYNDDVRCKAKSKQTGERCKQKAVDGKRVCRFHGGLSKGPPKGSKNALKTGVREHISLETLTAEERDFYDNYKLEPLSECEHNIKIYTIRESRILKRIASYNERKAEDYDNARIEYAKEVEKCASEGKTKPKFRHPMTLITTSQTISKNDEGQSTSVNAEPIDFALLRLEDALTKATNSRDNETSISIIEGISIKQSYVS